VAGPSISYDGNTLYFCANYEGGYGSFDIYYSTRDANGKWTEPRNIGKNINTKGYEGFPCISADGNKMYLVTQVKDLADGTVCFKILVTQRDKKGNWQEPKPLPAPININCDKAPRIMPDNKTIVFASIREGGKGDFDLYTSKLSPSGDWEEPVPMEFLNSPGKEQYATVPASGDYLLYSNDKGDILEVTIPFKYRQNKNITVKGKVIHQDTKEPLSANITVRDASTTQVLSNLENAADGSFTIILTAGKKYEITFEKKGFSTHTLEYDLIDLEDYKEFEEKIEMFDRVYLETSVIDDELYFPLNADIKITNTRTKESFNAKFTLNERGNKVYDLPMSQQYEIEIKVPKYPIYKYNLDLTGEVRFRNLEKEVELKARTKEFIINVKDNMTGEGVMVDVIITNLDLNETIVTQGYMTRDGKLAVNLREGSKYSVEVKNPQGYAFYNTNIDVDETSTSNINIGLTALKPNAKLLLKDIYFEYNSFELKEDSYEELLRVVKLLEQNPNLVIEVSAHTDNIGSAAFNKKLSERRAQHVVDFMTARNIKENRLTPVGYGKDMPIAPNDTEENRSKNRRLELKILSIN
jgi:outer membrane protein OmpA-like peptidoglycan-associated protein